MNRKIGILTTLFFTLILLMSSIQEAQAKRFGGGGSFGGRSSYSAPYKRSTSPGATSQPARSASQQQAASQNQTARQGLASRGGLMGMLGGLALGGLLGSLFFGGAFENFNFMDILVFAGIAFLVMRLFAAKNKQKPATANNTYAKSSHSDSDHAADYGMTPPTGSTSAGFNTDLMSGIKNSSNSTTTDSAVNLPADFDQSGFLAGAESAYRYLQTAWDNHDLAAIRGLATDKVFIEIQDQLRSNASNNKTEVLKVNAELLEVRQTGNDLEAAVLFDCILREDDGETDQVREVWHFVKPVNSKQTKWLLDGIQQLEI
ncbi:preprotein translocase subunit Tim44 [Methylomonas lenta]|uniref:Preprotein translocase subunit Tim44 n=1 Tax=Methylomonas lenta TaxID=980561 RepID=A0A177NHC2_9GAMM|nr:Tim44-like domain-containing protein [Methylomonas lenta]OAI17281.1 preprotein translocase subunit Tim44 [Methylomonas lenta]